MSAPRKIMFVCTGNICRSAMAEHLLRHLAAQRGLDLEVQSCGIAAEGWFEVPAVVRRLLSEKGVPPFEHKASLATRDRLKWADLVLVMTELHLENLQDRFPELSARIALLREAAGFGPQDVEDPMGRPDEAYVKSLADIDEALSALIESGFVPRPA
jgi:protein-tyrosine phosphatase